MEKFAPHDTTADDDELNSVAAITVCYRLLLVMKFFGLYFPSNRDVDQIDEVRNELRVRPLDGRNSNFPTKLDTSRTQNARSATPPKSRVYATVMAMVICCNLLRYCSVFQSTDTFDGRLILKLSIFSWMLLCVILQLSLYWASHTGKLDSVLRRLRVRSDKLKCFVIGTLVRRTGSWIIAVVAEAAFVAYFYLGSGTLDFVLAPLVTYVSANDTEIKIAKAVFSVIVFFMFQTWVLPMAISYQLALIVSKEFRYVNEQFVRVIDVDGKFLGNIKQYRQQHERLCEIVSDIDSFTKFCNVGGFFCHMLNTVTLLYASMIYQFSDPMAIFSFVFYSLANFVGLAFSTFNGVVVNHEAHKLSHVIHDIDLSLLDHSEINEVILMEKRLTGDRIGFSILGIVVISKQMILSLLGLIITYFLLIIQMAGTTNNSSSDMVCLHCSCTICSFHNASAADLNPANGTCIANILR